MWTSRALLSPSEEEQAQSSLGQHQRQSQLDMSVFRSEIELTNKLKESIANNICTEHIEEIRRETSIEEKKLKNHFGSKPTSRATLREGLFNRPTNSKQSMEITNVNHNLINNNFGVDREKNYREDNRHGNNNDSSNEHNKNNYYNNNNNNSYISNNESNGHHLWHNTMKKDQHSGKTDQANKTNNDRINSGGDNVDDDDDDISQVNSPVNPFHLRRDWYSALATFAAGGLAGAASRTLTAPLDRIKIIVQEGHLINTPEALWSSGRKHARLIDAARLIKADGGWHAFWRGNLVNCFKAGPEFAIVFTLRRYLFSLYDECIQREEERRKVATAKWRQTRELSGVIAEREELERHAMMMSTTHSHVEPTHSSALTRSEHGSTSTSNDPIETSSSLSTSPLAKHTSSSSYSANEVKRAINLETSIMSPPLNQWWCLSQIPMLAINCFIGATAGLVAQSLLYPMELVKTRVCVSRSGEYKGGVREIIYDAYRTGGIREFFRGCTPNMVGIIVYRGLEMGFYSSAQQSIMLYRMQWQNKSRHQAALSTAEVGAVGAVASIIAQTISYPLNVVRTRLQTQGSNGRQYAYSGMIDCFVQLVRRKGVRSLFSGLTANYLKAVPASTCTFIVFEKVQEYLLGDDEPNIIIDINKN